MTEESYDYRTMGRQLDKAKSAVFMARDAAFFGPLMCALDFVWDTGTQTAATDGSTFWWGPKDFNRCVFEGKGEDKTTIMHELWHVARLHALRRGNRCPDKWNEACDIKINRDLKNAGYYIGTDWLLKPEYDHLDLEEDIYDELSKNPGKPNPHNHCQHGKIKITDKTKQQMVNTTIKAVQSAKLAGKPGSIPGGVEMVLNKFLAPKIAWEQHLHMFMQDLLEEEHTWARPNRRYCDMYLPSKFIDEGRLEHLVYYLDVSGSVSDHDVLRFNSEVKYIKDTYNPLRLTLVQFDTRITKIVEFTEDDPFDEMVIIGRGGTDLEPVRQHMMEVRPTAAIVFSDLCCDPIESGPDCPIIWIAVGNQSAKVPFGKLIHLRN